MFSSFGRGQQQVSEALAVVCDDVREAGDGAIVAQYQTTRIRHMWSSYKRFDNFSLTLPEHYLLGLLLSLNTNTFTQSSFTYEQNISTH